MRRAARVDLNQAGIVKALRGVGASVQSLAAVGKGCPDLLVSFQARLYLLEVKCKEGRNPTKFERAHSGLNQAEWDWHLAWSSDVHIVWNADEALQVIGATA